MNQVILKLYETYKKYLGRGSGWIIDLVIYHILYILKYYPLDARIYMKLHKDLNHAKNGLINTELKDFTKLYKDFTKEPYSFLVKGAILPSDIPLRFVKNLLQNDFQ